jgi:hypothetical protein
MSIHLMSILLHKTKRKRKRFQVALACLLCIQQNTPFLQSPLMLCHILLSSTVIPLHQSRLILHHKLHLQQQQRQLYHTNSTKKLSSYNFFCHTNNYFNVTLTKLVHKLKIDMTSPFTLPQNVTEKLNPKPLHI